MITLTCAQCKAVLTVDDAFAGGACRCQHCGTIQTVPRHLKGGGSAAPGGAQGAATASGRATQSKTLYTKQARPGGSSTGLEDLVGVVTSSGLRSARLRRESPDDGRRRRNVIFATCAGVIGALAMAVGYLFWAQNGPSSATPLASSPVVGAIGTRGAAPAAPKAPDTPNFCGIALDDTSTVVYVLDRGDSTRDLFGYLKSACYRSINSLGPKRKFQVIFWDNDNPTDPPLMFPKDAPAPATAENLDACRKAFDELTAQGKTDVTAAFERAVAMKPSAIVIATAKAWEMDDSFVARIQRLRAGVSAKVCTVALTDPGSSTALKTVAQESGGTYKVITEGDLREFAE